MVSHPQEEICIYAIEVWTTIATEDAELGFSSQNLIKEVGVELIQRLLGNLTRVSGHENEEEGFFLIRKHECLGSLH